MALTCLPMFRGVKAIKLLADSITIVIDKADNKKLKALNEALLESKYQTRGHMPRG